MSVINKMLRDLDHRQSPPDATGAPGTVDALRLQGVASVPLHTAGARRRVHWGWVLLLVLVATGAGWWQWQQMQTVAPAPPSPPAVVVAPPAVAPAPVVVAAPLPPVQEEVVEAPSPQAMVLPPSGLRMETALSSNPIPPVEVTSGAMPNKVVAAPHAKTVSPAPPAVVVAEAPKKSAAAALPPSPAVATPMPAPPAADAAGLAQRQQQAARETLAQAQALWNSGARDNAIALLQDAVAAAERAAQTNASAANSQTLVSMLRELARMELAEGRASAVWDLLTRLEPLMANQPELWALRANAAQRLGRHQDSVQAYTTALQSRPNEQRWLLGAAVSLAALGQTTAAGEMADKARAVGPVSKEVQTYLRQQGVPLADR
ncbi:tetratricopeptide repeat protein [Rhodoferax saidenbachensis]|uniref:Tetratricopeptide repeat-like domain-containing protein n=1 Tax=Rhodoferax saidenbachensis TaxID=1484693 RepID=A0ABU1ZN50_9BURK|nr:tetratricopeptide repeat protein [Rhodoferax saidenbachensis]MDR7306959.1 hypothetical protein [Rhodoferax saidenbachensis]